MTILRFNDYKVKKNNIESIIVGLTNININLFFNDDNFNLLFNVVHSVLNFANKCKSNIYINDICIDDHINYIDWYKYNIDLNTMKICIEFDMYEENIILYNLIKDQNNLLKINRNEYSGLEYLYIYLNQSCKTYFKNKFIIVLRSKKDFKFIYLNNFYIPNGHKIYCSLSFSQDEIYSLGGSGFFSLEIICKSIIMNNNSDVNQEYYYNNNANYNTEILSDTTELLIYMCKDDNFNNYKVFNLTQEYLYNAENDIKVSSQLYSNKRKNKYKTIERVVNDYWLFHDFMEF